MKNKPQKLRPKSLLVECKLIKITDPAEQAEIDRRFAEAENVLAEGANSMKATPRKGK
jgi:hypothetical protein